ncbi:MULTISPECIES: transposase [unclassified Microbacterium]|uniref:transposase n=1 Tax=unclassified Microbacterium TaxID=2609290 RepID=UPI00365CD687
MTDLETIAAGLYTVPLGDFVSSRNARAKEAENGDVAESIRALRKPSVAAWVVNVFARERAEQLGRALQLADELREAQADIDAVTLAQLTRQRRALTDQLAADAAALATARGERVTPATREAVRQTITAAFFDPLAAAAVASGRLVHELEPSAGLPLDLEAILGGGAPSRSSAPQARPVDEVKAQRERRKAQGALHDAEQAHARATRDLGAAHREVRDASARAAQLDTRIADLEAELARAHTAAGAARAETAAAEDRRTKAADHAMATGKAVEAAQRALDALNAET